MSSIVLVNTFSSRVPLMVFEANIQEELITQSNQSLENNTLMSNF